MRSLYSDSSTWLHAVPAAIKLLLLAGLGTLLYLLDSPYALVTISLGCMVLALSIRRAMQPALGAVKALVLTGLLVFAFHAVLHQPLQGLVSGLRIISTSLLGIAMTVTTRADALLEVFERLLMPLRFMGSPCIWCH